jgi:DNA-binding LacI/PurR family transcriptional regulator
VGPATIKTIAEEARVSIATVSRVINRPELVAETTRRRVARVIQENDFRVSREAQRLRRRDRTLRTGRVGGLVPDFPHRSVEAITEEMTRGAQKVFQANNIELLLHYFQYDADPLLTMPRFLRENSVDGILVRPPPTREQLLEFCRNRKAVVLGNTFADVDWAGMRLVMNHLFALGHRRIGFVGPTTQALIYLRRLQAYRHELEHRGISHDERLVKLHPAWVIQAEETATVCRRFVEELRSLESPPTAIAAATDGFAAGIMAAAREAGWRVPDELSVIGFGDQHYTPFLEPPLTTARVDQRATGELGALLLLRMIESPGQSLQTLVTPTLIERGSCAAVGG